MRAALQMALSGGHEFRAYNAFLFLYVLYCADLRNDEAEQIFNEALAYCDLHDVGKPCLLAERAGVFEKLGRWDECVSTIGAVLDERSLSPANRMQSLSILAKVMARRGQDGYWQYLDEARDSSIGLEEPEWLIFVGLARIEAYWLGAEGPGALSWRHHAVAVLWSAFALTDFFATDITNQRLRARQFNVGDGT